MKARMVVKEDDGAIPATPLVVVVCIAAGLESSEKKLQSEIDICSCQRRRSNYVGDRNSVQVNIAVRKKTFPS